MITGPPIDDFDVRLTELILDAAGEGIYGLDRDGRTTFVNPAAASMLGFRVEELIGQPMHAVLHHSHADGKPYLESDCPIHASFEDGRVHVVTHEVFWRRDGSAFPVEYVSTPIRIDGELRGAVVVFSDITARVVAERELRAALDEVQTLKDRLRAENEYLQEEIDREYDFRQIVGDSEAIRRTLHAVKTVAGTDASVLITGETGTGKELIARAVHDLSERRNKSLIKVNCASIPHDLFESEFFGHVRGAFTGAVRDRAGRFSLADRGSIFLDEVGEIPIDMQSKLLRVLQEGTFEPVGEPETRTVDVRVIASTNRDLEAAVARGRFREDLYYRLNVFPIPVAPLRERGEDITTLASYFLESARVRLHRSDVRLTEANVADLLAYEWPGNVRELRNVIERAMIRARPHDGLHLDLPASRESGQRRLPEPQRILSESELRSLERANTLAALAASDWKVSGAGGAAERLGIRPTTLASRIKKFGLTRPASAANGGRGTR